VSDLLSTIARVSPETAFVQLSSAAVYGNPEEHPTTEETALIPVSPYGYHKVLSEKIVQEYHDIYDISAVSLRIFSAFGEGLKRQLFWDLHQKSQTSNTVRLLGTGQESRDFIYIDDVVQAIGLVMMQADFEGEVYNVANGTETTIHDAARVFLDESGWRGRLTFSQETHDGHPANWQADISKIQQLGYVQGHQFVDGIRNYCKWLKQL
jgi:dTDP-glucose 4,6-dehydratase/UDP-glucose 4-epimerase